MKRVIKSSLQSTIVTVEFDVPTIDECITEIFSSSELNIAEKLIQYQVINTIEDVVIQSYQIIQSYGFIVIDYGFDSAIKENEINRAKISPYNNDTQKSFYIYFYHPKDEQIKRIKFVNKLQITDHDYTKVNEYGDIIIDKDRADAQNLKGSEIDRAYLEGRLQKNISAISSIMKIKINGKTIESLKSVLYDLEEAIALLADEYN